MILLITRITFHAILIVLDFIIYFLPILTLCCLIPNLLLTYVSSILHIYSCIFENKYDLKIRIYLFLSFPIIIILYIAIFTSLFIGFSIFMTLIDPLITTMARPEYPFYSLSSTAAIIHSAYQLIAHN